MPLNQLTAVAFMLHMIMVDILQTDAYTAWFVGLRDKRAKAKILGRVDRLSQGNPGDVAPVGDGVSEMRIDFGPGYRVYYKSTGKEILLLLCGGDKSSQDRDIKLAKELAST